MKILIILIVFIFPIAAVKAQENKTNDWANLFPEIADCERIIQPLTQNGKVFEQTAVYKPANGEQNQIFPGCGSITLQVQPSLKKSADANYATQIGSPFTKKLKIKDFDAYSVTPICGNDDSRETLYIYFDKDKALIINAKRGFGNILEFAESADYELMKKSLSRFIENKNETK